MKKFFAISFVVAGVGIQAQSIGNSPYAVFGIGDVKYDKSIDIASMGGISTAYVSDFNNKFNFHNPAANRNFNLTTFNVEVTNENNFFKSDYQNQDAKKHSTYLSNISLAFPLSPKLKFGLGYQPYSSKTYTISSSTSLDLQTTQYNRFKGTGTLSTIEMGLGYSVTPELSVGLRVNHNFGTISDSEEVTYSNANLVSGYATENKVKMLNLTAATVYQTKVKDDKKITIGASYTFGNIGYIRTYYRNSTYYYYNSEKINESIIEEKDSETKNLIPQEASLGLGYGKDTKWFLGTQFDFKKGRTLEFLGQSFEYKNSYRFAAGGWILPNYNNFRNYFSRVIYRFGAYYEKGSLSLNPLNSSTYTNINEFGVTGGMYLPFNNSNINRLNGLELGFEVGKRGTMKNNLIDQTFVNFKVGLNFADKWFQKRTYE